MFFRQDYRINKIQNNPVNPANPVILSQVIGKYITESVDRLEIPAVSRHAPRFPPDFVQ